MRLQKLFICVFLLALPGTAVSFNDCVNISLGVEALFWKPCIEPFHYGEIVNPPEATGTSNVDHQLSVDPEYETGFRIFANVADKCYCKFLDVEWAHVDGCVKRTSVDPSGPVRLVGFPFAQFTSGSQAGNANSVRARQETRYDKVSAKAGYRLCGNECSWFYGYLGGRWLRIDVLNGSAIDLVANSAEPGTSQVSSCTEFHGGGFEVGFGGHADLWCGFGASARMGAIAAIGCRDHVFLQFNQAGELNRRNLFSDGICSGGFELRGALNYIYCCSCWWIRFEAGYELDYYLKMLLREQPTVQSPSVIAENFGMGGPYIGLTIGF